MRGDILRCRRISLRTMSQAGKSSPARTCRGGKLEILRCVRRDTVHRVFRFSMGSGLMRCRARSVIEEGGGVAGTVARRNDPGHGVSVAPRLLGAGCASADYHWPAGRGSATGCRPLKMRCQAIDHAVLRAAIRARKMDACTSSGRARTVSAVSLAMTFRNWGSIFSQRWKRVRKSLIEA